MPELPEVETVKRGLHDLCVGQTVLRVLIRHERLRWIIPNSLKKQLRQHTMLSVERRAKYLLLNFSSGTLIMHLGMSGVCRVLPASDPYIKHDHFVINFVGGLSLRLNDPRRFGSVLWGGNDPYAHKLLKSLGPEPLSRAFNSAYMLKAVCGRRVCIKTWLMTNRNVVGVGNIYANEVLFLSKIHPLRPVMSLSNDDVSRLCRHVKTILRQAIKAGGTTLKDFKNTDGRPGYFSNQLYVYGREGEPCLVCKTDIQTVVIAQRRSFFCSKCQCFPSR